MPNTDIRSFTPEELKEVLKELGQPAYRADQVFSWIHQKLAEDYGEMTNLPASLRQQLSETYDLTPVKAERIQRTSDGNTEKYLFRLRDGNYIESVLMRYDRGNSVCISSQVGCRMGCTFCASTLDGLVRNLTAGEMLDQVYRITRETGERVDNIVVMGQGEPMDNYDNLIRFIQLVSHEKGLHLSKRSITVSTCGIVPGIRKFAEENLPVTLALSLHAAFDDKRKKMMPVANAYSIAELMDACDYYQKTTGRRITLEYALAEGVNDTPEDVQALTRLSRHRGFHINLIPINPVVERSYKGSSKSAAVAFRENLEKNGVNVTIRKEMGREIDGACGQLRQRHKEENV